MTDPITARWVPEREVCALLTLPLAISALRAGLPAEAAGSATTMVKTHSAWGDHATLHALGGAMPDLDLVGTKTWAHTPGGACPLLLLFGSTDGQLRGVIEAFALGQLRTAAISALATDLLALPDAAELAIAGAGKQAVGQVAAVVAVRPIRRVRVWSRSPTSADTLAARLTDELGVAATTCSSPGALVAGAPIVTLATRATTPFLDREAPSPGTHLNAVGAITPERAEFASDLLDRAGVVAADSVSQARRLSRELRDHYGDDEAAWAGVRPLSDLLATGARRPSGVDLTVFKAMGIGLADVVLGAVVLRLAAAAGLGRPLPAVSRARPSFRSDRQDQLITGSTP